LKAKDCFFSFFCGDFEVFFFWWEEMNEYKMSDASSFSFWYFPVLFPGSGEMNE
jgi:hypothetical protein